MKWSNSSRAGAPAPDSLSTPDSRSAPPLESEPTPTDLLDLSLEHRAALSRVDAASVATLEEVTGRLSAALQRLGRRSGRALPAGFDAATVTRLQAELRINHELLARTAHQNRQGLNLLFGEPDLYSRQT